LLSLSRRAVTQQIDIHIVVERGVIDDSADSNFLPSWTDKILILVGLDVVPFVRLKSDGKFTVAHVELELSVGVGCPD
jgi:hypothetical protein